MKVTANATRSEGWWAVEVPEIDGLFTQVRRLDQIVDMVRDAAELLEGIDPDALDVEIFANVPHRDMADRARELTEHARRTQEEASRAMRCAAQSLSKDGLTVRDIGNVLGVSFQRAPKLLSA